MLYYKKNKYTKIPYTAPYSSYVQNNVNFSEFGMDTNRLGPDPQLPGQGFSPDRQPGHGIADDQIWPEITSSMKNKLGPAADEVKDKADAFYRYKIATRPEFKVNKSELYNNILLGNWDSLSTDEKLSLMYRQMEMYQTTTNNYMMIALALLFIIVLKLYSKN
tara:strand:+ start:6859 stop:7347 length:489 start_codon:yes stop_codon:yes gene_type:complete